MSAYLVINALRLTLKRCSALPTVPHKTYMGNKGKELAVLERIIGPNEEQEALTKERPERISVVADAGVAPLSGVPTEHIQGRLARIYLTPKNAMQSGTANVDHWEMEFETRDRWENPLMGWSSSGDPLSNMKLQFTEKEDAIRYAERMGYRYYIDTVRKDKPKVKSYGFNFSWDKRSRVSTK